MRRLALFVLMAALLAVTTGVARADTEVKITGDSRVYGDFFTGHNFTGKSNPGWTSNTPTWSNAGAKSEEKFVVWERIRVQSDFKAGKDVKFRLSVKVDDTWGHGTYTAANPTNAVQVYKAYLQFKWPGTDTQITAGLQPLSFPQTPAFFDSLLFADFASAFVVEGQIMPDTLGYTVGFARMLDTNQTFDTANQVGDELDFYFLTLPITGSGFKATPWTVVGVAGKYTGYYTAYASSFAHANYAEDLISGGTLLGSRHWKNNQQPYIWAGSTFELTALDPVRFYADIMYGSGAFADRKRSQRHGWFLDAAAEYTGWTWAKPQIFGWWSTGEDGSTSNGSERIAHTRPNWGPGQSFLFDDGQVYGRNGEMGIDPAGTWGLAASLDKISYMPRLSHRVTVAYTRGTNSPTAIRDLNNALGSSNPYFILGRNLTWNEYAVGVNFDTTYNLYENLNILIETGWARGHFQKSAWASTWGNDLVNRANNNDAWKIAFGFTYKY
jgi:hypothetical protein